MNAAHYSAVMSTPLSGGERLGLCMAGDSLLALDFLPATHPTQAARDGRAQRVVEQLQAYFRAPGQVFELRLAPQGSPYQQRVWEALRSLSPGRPQSYGTLARQLGSGARALANACRANPIPIIIPCHRVVAAHGAGGYMGQTAGPALAIKQWLLEHERGSGRG